MSAQIKYRGPGSIAEAVAKGMQPPSCAVLGHKEINRMQELCAPHDHSEADRRAELRKTSDERVKHWPNTIEASRLKKEAARKERMERDEARRVVIDNEERELQEARKESAIRKANLLLYEENDRIKNFKSKLFLATVLDERQKQIAIKAERDKIHHMADSHWALMEQEQLLRAEEKEAEKKKAIQDRAQALKEEQLDQLEQIRQIKIKDREADREEGKAIARQVALSVADEKAVDERRLVERKKIAKELVKSNDEVKVWRAKRHEREKREEAEIAEYARLKDAQMLERKKRVDEKFVAKIARRQRLIDRQADFLAELKAATEEREMKAMRDFERERDERESAEAAKRDKRERENQEFSSQQRMRKQIQKAKEEAERLRMQGVWKDRAQLLIEEELADRTEAKREAEKLQRFHLLQAQEKERQKLREREQEIEDGLLLQEAIQDEQDVYHAYVNSVMGEYVKYGRDASLVKSASKPKVVRSIEHM